MSVSQDLVKLLGLAAIAVLLWNGCDRGREADSPAGTGAMAALHYFTWSDYVSPELIHEFEQAHGARVVVDTFSSNEELLAKLQGGASGYDVTVPSDFMVSIMAAQGMLADLDRNALPNLKALEPHLQHPAFDPTHRYAVPYLWGTVGIGYDSAVVTPPPDSWDILWDKRYRGRISMLNDQREVFGAVLRSMGQSMNTTDPTMIEAAKQKLIAQKPLVKTYASEHYDQLLASGDVVLAQGWGGPVARAMRDRALAPLCSSQRRRDDLGRLPRVLQTSPNKASAMQFINFLIDARVAARTSERLLFAASNREARAWIRRDILENPAVYPPAELIPRMEWMGDVGKAMRTYDRAWTELKMQ